jgi:pimeloyl-ACP methyl ester carboxylesterase
MPTVVRPGDVEIHWQSRGDGPVVLILPAIWSYPAVYEDLIADLERDHSVVTYDPRGCGQSTQTGPYDLRTDIDDLAAVAEAAGGRAVALSVANGFQYAVHVATERPELISQVAGFGPAAAAMLPRGEAEGAGMLVSRSVIDMLMTLQETDPRSASRAIIAATNPQLGEQELQERIDHVTEYVSADGAIGRSRAWLEDDAGDEMLALRDRLWILYGGNESALFEDPLTERVAKRFPEAHLEPIDVGPITRPDVTAAVVRRIVAQTAG